MNETPLEKWPGVLRHRGRRVLTGAALAFFGASGANPTPAHAQAPDLMALAGGDVVEVRVINLDVRAFDRSGRPVDDLRPEELELRIDRQPTPIRYFARVSPDSQAVVATSSAVESVSTPQPPLEADRTLRVALFVDNFFLGPASRLRATQAMTAFLEQGLPDDAEVLLATFDRQGLAVRVPFTRSRKRVKEALEGMSLASSDGFRRDAERRSTLVTLRELQRSKFESARWDTDPPCSKDLLELARGYAGSQFSDLRRSLEGLRLFVDSLASTPGRKAIVHVSDGLPLRAGIEAFEYLRLMCDGSGLRQGLQWTVDVVAMGSDLPRGAVIDIPSLESAVLEFDSVTRLRDITTRANSHGVALYPLQASGLAAVGGDLTGEFRSSTAESDGAIRFNSQDALFNLASETGGRAILQRNDLGVALGAVADDFSRYLSLGFDPPTPAAGGSAQVHAVELRTTRPGVELRYRKSYQDATSASRAAEKLLAALFHGATEAGLSVAADIVPRKPPDKPGFVLRLSIATAQLALLDGGGGGGGGGRSGLLVLHMVVQDDEGLSPVRRADVPLRFPPSGSEPPFVYEVRFATPKGKATVAIAIEDAIGRKVAVIRREIG